MPKVKFKSKKAYGFIPCSKYGQSITVQKFFQLYDIFLNDKKLEGLSKRTIDDYKKHIDFIKKYLKTIDKPDDEKQSMLIDNQFFKNYIYYMAMEKHYAATTINIRLTTLKCYLNWLFNKEYTAQNYSLSIKKMKTEEDTILPLCNTDIKKMLKQPCRDTYAGLRDFTIMVTILDTGIRINELVNTLITDIDLKERILNVRGEVSKTRKSRQLPLSKQSVFLLKQLIDISVENNSNYVFMSTNTCNKVDKNVVIRNFERYGRNAGIKVRCTPHVFRHTFATNAVKAGIDIFTLQKILGHSCISTTRKYIQLNTQDLIKKHDQIDTVSRYFKGGRR